MKVLSHEDILNIGVEPKDCYNWVSDILRNKKHTILPAKISIKPTEDIFYNVMPSIIPRCDCAGLKVVTRYPRRVPSLDSQIMLYDYSTGKIKALLDGNFITTMRTGAVAAHSIMLLAKADFKSIGVIGLGNQARATMNMVLSLLSNRKIMLKLFKYKDQHKLFEGYIKSLTHSNHLEYEFCNTYEDTIRGSDVVVSSATYLADDLCGDECFAKGCLVVPIHTRGFMNCDLFFDKIFADDTAHVKDFKYFNQFKMFAEVSDVVNNMAKGRENSLERIIVYNIGLSIYDLYFAEKIYQLANSTGRGREINLNPPTDKFWM